MRIVLILYVFVSSIVGVGSSAAQEENTGGRKKLIQKVTDEEVKRFLVP